MRKVVKSLKDQLASLDLKKLRLSDGRRLDVAMADEAKRLRDCIQKYINTYYRSYSPTIYGRTEGYAKALYAEDVADVRVSGNTLKIGVSFRLSDSMHPSLQSVFSPNRQQWISLNNSHNSFVPLLMERGWESNGLAAMLGRKIPRLTHFEGIQAVKYGIEEFNKTNPLGIKVDAEDFYNGKVY